MNPLQTTTPLRLLINQSGVTDILKSMFDRVKILQKGDYLGSIPNYLEDCEEVISKQGNPYYKGHLRGLNIACHSDGVVINGSWAKFKYGENITELDIISTKEVMDEVSELLHTDISNGDITQLEIGTNMFTEYPPKEYLLRLGNKRGYEREAPYAETIRFTNGDAQRKRELIFYNKGLEALKKGELTNKYKDLNILRYEMKFSGVLKKQLGTGIAVTTELLVNPKFYHSMKTRLKQEYNTIDKVGFVSDTVLNTIKKPSDGIEVLFADMITEIGIRRYNEKVKRIEESGRLSRKQLEQFRKKTKSYMGLIDTETDTIIQELNAKIESL